MDDLMTRSDLTVAECDELRSLALAMPIENVPVETRELAKQLQFIEATLPSKNTDEQSGQMRTAVYARILGGSSGRHSQRQEGKWWLTNVPVA